MPEIKKIKRNRQIFAGCNLHRAVIGSPSLIGCVFPIEMHYRTNILHRAIFNRQPTKISGKIHCRTNMQESSKLSLSRACILEQLCGLHFRYMDVFFMESTTTE